MTTKFSTWLGGGLVALGALGFASGIVFNRAITGLTGPRLSFFRALAGFLFFSLWVGRYPAMVRVRQYRAAFPHLLGLGLAVGATALLYMTALRHTTVAMAVLLNNTSAVYVALLAPWLLHENSPRFTVLSVTLALVGMGLLIDLPHVAWRSADMVGVILAIGCGMTYAFAMMFSRFLHGRVGGMTQSWWSTGIAALMALPFALGTPWPAVRANGGYLLALGTISLGLPYLLLFQGLKHIPAQTGSIIALLEPVAGVLLGILLYHEMPTTGGWLGMGLILTSIIVITCP